MFPTCLFWIDPGTDFNFRILVFSGEPGAGVPATKKRIEDTYGGICIDTGSTAEMTPWMTNGECEHRKGMHLWQDIVYAELVDSETEKRVPYNEEGETVYTHLERASQPMIRFRAGDISMWTLDPCPCGRTYPRLPRGVYGRADDMFVVRGENVYPSAIENAIRAIDGFGDEFRIVITREKTMDELIGSACCFTQSRLIRTWGAFPRFAMRASTISCFFCWSRNGSMPSLT